MPSAVTAGFEFKVLAPVWQRWWFLSATLGLCLTGGYALYRHRLSRVQQVAEMRARIARDLHDDIGANLTRIAVLSEVARREQGQAAAAADAPAGVDRDRRSRIDDGDERHRVGDQSRPRSPRRSGSSRMREYTEEIFVSDGVELTFSVPETLRDLRLGARAAA